ncbi:hypothetical protein [Latilactobacillus curvatus]|uniref:hypothetical protein n=1 Tax=Latilactobacillus curvatus TaxID=28038 RepID=UPI0009761AB8|nr:hypothetical protein [Latilactobacillus curvatus]
MTAEQETFKRFLEWSFEDHAEDIIRTIVWLNSHMIKIRREYPKEYLAYKALSNQELNQVICEVLLPF